MVGLPGLAVPKYALAPGLWVLTTYYNPFRYQTRRYNYDIFAQSLRKSGVPFVTVECAFGDEPFELPERLDVVRVRAPDLLWQKERLLNLAASWLPKSCKYAAWLDCDILFGNQNWAVDAARLLESHAIVQVFETCLRLDRGNVVSDSPDEVFSFGAVAPGRPDLLSCGRYDRHGHTGYGWAMRKEIFDEVGLYEYAVSGSGDHYVAHAIYNEYGFCIKHALKHNPRQIRHLKEWGEKFYGLVRGNFTAVPGKIRHLWHGELKNRLYLARNHKIIDFGFDPYNDVIAKPGRPLEWHSEMNKPDLRRYFTEYFDSRREDG